MSAPRPTDATSAATTLTKATVSTMAPSLGLTTSQTVGPFYSPALLRDARNVVPGTETSPARVRIEGRVIDGAGDPVADALVEIWQANEHGRYNHPLDRRDLPLDPAFTGFGRAGADDDGAYWFETVKPGAVPYDGDRFQAPHLSVTVFARGLLNHVATRLYFPDEPANDADPILALVPPHRRATLIARRAESDGNESSGPAVYLFDVVLQGRDETVFFNV